MPLYDRKCGQCGYTKLDCWEPITMGPLRCLECYGPFERVLLPHTRAVIGDEIDVSIRHGLCWPNGEPRRFTSRAELRAAEHAGGWTNLVEHKGVKGSDKSPHTVNWGTGLPSGVDGRPYSLLTPEEQAARSAEWAAL